MTNEKELKESMDAQASTENRTSRSAKTRAKDTARKPWRPPSMLETPPAPEGYSYRWIRAEELDGFEIPTLDDGRHAGVVSVGGLLLAKIPDETRLERNAYFQGRAQTQQDAVDNDLMQESDPASPILRPERKTSVTFGGGNRE